MLRLVPFRQLLIVLLVSGDASASEVHTAAEKGNLDVVKKLVDADKTLITKTHGHKNWTPLHAAINRHQIPVVEYLVSKGADVNASDKDGKTPLHLATQFRFPPTPAKKTTIPTVRIVGPQHRIQLAKYLISHGANVNAVDLKNESVLFDAVSNNRLPSFAEFLIGQGAKTDVASKSMAQTPLWKAAYLGHVDTVRVLIKSGADLQIGETTGYTPLSGAALAHRQYGGKEYAEIAELLIAAGAKVDNTSGVPSPMHFAARDGNVEVMKTLLKHKARVNTIDERGLTPLHHTTATSEEHLECLQLLIAAGADVNALGTINQETPLMIACGHRSPQSVELLLKQGAKIDTQDHDGATALFEAAQNFDMANIASLIKAHANPDLQDKYGRVPLAMLLRNPKYFPAAKLIIESGADINIQNRRGETLLYLLAETTGGKAKPEHPEMFTYMVQHGADPTLKNRDDKTPIDILRSHGRGDLIDLLKTKPGPVVKGRIPKIEQKAPTAAKPVYRTWTSSNGRFSVEAKLLSVDENFATLEKRDKRIIRVPLEKLSAADRSLAKREAAQ